MNTPAHANSRQQDRLDAEAREQRAASELAPSEIAGPVPVVAAVATGSVAGDAAPKPLPCRLADLLKDWRETRDNMKARKEDEAAMAVEVCMEMLHAEVGAFLTEWRAYHARKQSAKPQNIEISRRAD